MQKKKICTILIFFFSASTIIKGAASSSSASPSPALMKYVPTGPRIERGTLQQLAALSVATGLVEQHIQEVDVKLLPRMILQQVFNQYCFLHRHKIAELLAEELEDLYEITYKKYTKIREKELEQASTIPSPKVQAMVQSMRAKIQERLASEGLIAFRHDRGNSSYFNPKKPREIWTFNGSSKPVELALRKKILKLPEVQTRMPYQKKRKIMSKLIRQHLYNAQKKITLHKKKNSYACFNTINAISEHVWHEIFKVYRAMGNHVPVGRFAFLIDLFCSLSIQDLIDSKSHIRLEKSAVSSAAQVLALLKSGKKASDFESFADDSINLRLKGLQDIDGLFNIQGIDIHNIKKLNLSQNYFYVLPRSLGQLQQLKVIDLRYNPIAKIPERIEELKQLLPNAEILI